MALKIVLVNCEFQPGLKAIHMKNKIPQVNGHRREVKKKEAYRKATLSLLTVVVKTKSKIHHSYLANKINSR